MASMFLFNSAPTAIHILAEVYSLLFVVNGSTGHGLPSVQGTAQFTNIAPARASPWTQIRPLGLPRTQTSRWLQVAMQATQIRWLPLAAWPTDIDMALGSSIYHGHPHGRWW